MCTVHISQSNLFNWEDLGALNIGGFACFTFVCRSEIFRRSLNSTSLLLVWLRQVDCTQKKKVPMTRQRVRIWGIWWNIYATRFKSWSLNFKSLGAAPQRLGSALRLLLFFFLFHQHFYKGLVHVFVLSARKKKRFWESEEMFRVTMVINVCACGPGQQHFPAGGEGGWGGRRRRWWSCWMLFIRFHWATSVLWLFTGVENFTSLWPTTTERTRSLRRERATEEKSVNTEQPFLDVSKRGLNSTPDFYLSEYLLNVMKKKTRWDRC